MIFATDFDVQLKRSLDVVSSIMQLRIATNAAVKPLPPKGASCLNSWFSRREAPGEPVIEQTPYVNAHIYGVYSTLQNVCIVRRYRLLINLSQDYLTNIGFLLFSVNEVETVFRKCFQLQDETWNPV